MASEPHFIMTQEELGNMPDGSAVLVMGTLQDDPSNPLYRAYIRDGHSALGKAGHRAGWMTLLRWTSEIRVLFDPREDPNER